jgi:hypothetical protein
MKIQNKKKQNNPEPETITAEMTVVPQGQMVKPRSFIITISKSPLRKFIEKEVSTLISTNSKVRKVLRRE